MKLTKRIGIIGGSGFYDLAKSLKEVKIETPYGSPSDKLAIGKIGGKEVVFLPRHNKSHDIPPHKINFRANIWALKSLEVGEIITTTACGSLQTYIKPGDFVVLDQFVDRTRNRKDTFFDGPIVTHVSPAEPYCSCLSKLAFKTGKKLKLNIHEKGTVVVINGPRFSTKAESEWFTKMGWDVINMTQYPEVILAKEMEICYLSLAIATDWDVGLVAEGGVKPVSVEEVVKTFGQNIFKAKELIKSIIKAWPDKLSCSCKKSLKGARFN
ncbi:S-methyl-5'-thioadenosine phosphorylase [Patescibacteria group bacterium]